MRKEETIKSRPDRVELTICLGKASAMERRISKIKLIKEVLSWGKIIGVGETIIFIINGKSRVEITGQDPGRRP